MSMQFHQKKVFPSKYLLLILTGVCLVLIGLSLAFENIFAPLQLVTGVTVSPMQKGINSIGLWVTDRVEMINTIQDLQEENAALKAQLEEYQTENRIRVSDENELKDLRELYGLDSRFPTYEKVAANVVSKDAGNWFDNFVIDRGSKDGIQVGCNVICDTGLVGIVTEVGPNYAKVRSIIDDKSNVSAMFLSDSTLCTVTGDRKYIEQGYIHVEYIDKDAQVSDGDELITSTISDKFLPGIPIGYVSNLSLDMNNLTMSGDVKPIVDFKHIQTVLVILDLKENYQQESSEDAAPVVDPQDADVAPDPETASTEAEGAPQEPSGAE